VNVSTSLDYYRKVQRSFLSPPYCFHANGHRVYLFFFGGCCWQYYISSHKLDLLEYRFTFQETGTLSLGIVILEDMPFIQRAAHKIAVMGNGH
jgi:hypothetical protein